MRVALYQDGRKGRSLNTSTMKLAKVKINFIIEIQGETQNIFTSIFLSDYTGERKGRGVDTQYKSHEIGKRQKIFLHSKYFARLHIILLVLLTRSSIAPTEGNIIYIN